MLQRPAVIRKIAGNLSGLEEGALMRPLRILHIGNIANNAYSNAKLLREQGHECHVAFYDYYHFACCCEWQELDAGVDRSLIGDPLFPNFWRLGAQCPTVPRWFAHGPQSRVITYLRHVAAGERQLAEIAWACLRYARFKVVVGGDTLGAQQPWSEARFQEAVAGTPLTPTDRRELMQGRMFEQFDSLVRQGLRRVADDQAIASLSLPLDRAWLEAIGQLDPAVAGMLAGLPAGQVLCAAGIELDEGRSADGSWPANAAPEDAEKFSAHLKGWRWLMRQYDLVMAYGPDAVLPFLANEAPYVAYEHGTLRDIPYEDSSLGRLIAGAYPGARAVFITNNDYLTQKRQLPIEPQRLHPLPHAFDERPLRAFAERHGRQRSQIVTFFAPARQDWLPKVPIMMKNNHFVVHAAHELKQRGITNFRTIFVEWGVDVAATKALIDELDVGEHFVWVQPLPKHQLWEHYLDCHAVIDQFLLPSLSGVSFEALALGCRVLTRDDGVANRLAFGEQPPFLDGHDVASVTEAMLRIIEDPDDEAGIGKRSWDWVDRCHSGRRIVEIQERVFTTVMDELASPAPARSAAN